MVNDQEKSGKHILWSGEERCHDADGRPLGCDELDLVPETVLYEPWTRYRFEGVTDSLVRDSQTGLIWPREVSHSEFPVSWPEALRAIDKMNAKKQHRRWDWRLPNRRELRSLIDHSRSCPALPLQHPFSGVNLGWYWTSTTSAMARGYAWYLQLEGGRMFYGKKDENHWFWPVCGKSLVLPRTGQSRCYDTLGNEVSCVGSGSDGEWRAGVPWPKPRFHQQAWCVLDRLTGLRWSRQPYIGMDPMDWRQALAAVKRLAGESGRPWRMPTINEMESLVDCSTHTPALPAGSGFSGVHEGYWTTTTSGYERDWAYVMYLHKGAVGVGCKKMKAFQVWPVLRPTLC